jgi:hypothetical protein
LRRTPFLTIVSGTPQFSSPMSTDGSLSQNPCYLFHLNGERPMTICRPEVGTAVPVRGSDKKRRGLRGSKGSSELSRSWQRRYAPYPDPPKYCLRTSSFSRVLLTSRVVRSIRRMFPNSFCTIAPLNRALIGGQPT